MADRNKPGYMNYDDIADRLESGKLNAYDTVYTKDTHEVVFIKEDKSLIRMKCRLDVYPSVVVAEYYLNLNTDTYVGQIVGIEQGEWIRLYNVNYADDKFIVKKVGVDEYGQLDNKPQINGIVLEGNKTTAQLGINIPTKFSQLYDDIGYETIDHLVANYYSKTQVDETFATKNEVPDIEVNPEQTSETLTSIGINGVNYALQGSNGMIIKTTAEWEQVPQMRSIEGVWYVYSDYRQETDPVTHTTKNIPRVKIGDRFGTYVVDLPFTTMSITDADIAKWNSHVGVTVEGTNLSFFH